MEIRAMKKIVFNIYLFVSVLGVCQTRVSSHEAVFCAIRAMELRDYSNFRVNRVSYDITEQGDTLMFEVGMSNGYAVLLSGVKSCIPILAIYKSDVGQSIFLQTDLPAASFLVSLYRKMIEDQLSGNCRINIPSEWEFFLDTNVITMNPRAPSYLLATNWQEKESNDGFDSVAYNEQCPIIYGCHTPAGSAAVAMGQVMYYWNYPFSPIANNQQFYWCNMGDALITTDNCYETKRKSISNLLGECGSVTHSNYSCSYTETDPDNVIDAMYSYFHYYCDDEFKRQPFNPDPAHPEYAAPFQNFWDKIEDNIDEGRPIIGFLSEGDERYYFVCDGYDDDFSIHLNWGEERLNGDYFIYPFELKAFYLFGVSPKIEFSVGRRICLSDYYASCSSQIGNIPLYTIVPYTSDTLISASIISNSTWRTIPTGATAVYQAHEEINLEDGFEAEYGCEFEARIEPCEQCENGQRGGMVAGDGSIDSSFGEQDDTITDDRAYAMGEPRNTPLADLFPNPTDGLLTMVTDGMAEGVMVFDLLGHPIGGWHLDVLTEALVTLDVSTLLPGPYLLVVSTPSGTFTVRFLRR